MAEVGRGTSVSALRAVPVVLSALLLGAHFLRAGQVPLLAAALALPFLLLVRRPWAARALQAALLLGAIEWMRTLVMAASARQASALPWTRLAFILGAVALLTAASALTLRPKPAGR